ncbi:unnamed protein product [Symbiodinium natans]|uniref:Endonuclease/exonuclease/phosphatase domain-containing protein n=1 Tax=Symbiodinium natans TaxID=878477 RepID=A0A812PQZ6_9DINO|nr:unnamed protein product [Symbiodinium natans]
MRAIDKPLFATFTFFLTANLNKTGITKNPLAAELAREAQASFISLQEIDVNYLSAPGFVEAWRHEGYSALLSAGDVNKGSHRVALVSKVPLRQVNLGLARAQPRHVAGLVELCSGSRKHHLLVIAAYGFPGDLEATSEMLRELVEAARAFGGSFVIFGDFNATADEGYIVEATASGVVNVLDADFEEALPFTNPYRADPNTGEKRRTRRIDYAIADRSTLASRVEHFERPDLSDHLCVRCDLEVECRRSDYVLPKFQELSLQDEAAIGLNFDAVWDEELFSTYLDADQKKISWTRPGRSSRMWPSALWVPTSSAGRTEADVAPFGNLCDLDELSTDAESVGTSLVQRNFFVASLGDCLSFVNSLTMNTFNVLFDEVVVSCGAWFRASPTSTSATSTPPSTPSPSSTTSTRSRSATQGWKDGVWTRNSSGPRPTPGSSARLRRR